MNMYMPVLRALPTPPRLHAANTESTRDPAAAAIETAAPHPATLWHRQQHYPRQHTVTHCNTLENSAIHRRATSWRRQQHLPWHSKLRQLVRLPLHPRLQSIMQYAPLEIVQRLQQAAHATVPMAARYPERTTNYSVLFKAFVVVPLGFFGEKVRECGFIYTTERDRERVILREGGREGGREEGLECMCERGVCAPVLLR